MATFLEEFKSFAVKGNLVDMAVGVVIGNAFSKIVSSFVSDIIMPPIGILVGGVDFSSLSVVLREATDTTEAVTLNYGLFVNSIVDFLIISLSIFIAVRYVLRRQKKEATTKTTQKPSEDTQLLREIRDTLQAQNRNS